jgi:hypothetical protein
MREARYFRFLRDDRRILLIRRKIGLRSSLSRINQAFALLAFYLF